MGKRKERHTQLINSLAERLFPFQESEDEQETFTGVGRKRVDEWLDEVLAVPAPPAGETPQERIAALEEQAVEQWRMAIYPHIEPTMFYRLLAATDSSTPGWDETRMEVEAVKQIVAAALRGRDA